MHIIDREPYRVHFLIGTSAAIVGAAFWTLFSMGWIVDYPRQAHSMFMVFGFLMSFVCGFLMTAIPRMTGSQPASRNENLVQTLATFVILVLAGTGHFREAGIACLLQLATLIAYLFRRVTATGGSPPRGFIFIPLGLFSALLGEIIFLFNNYFSSEVIQWGKLLLFEAFILNLIVGLGSRLIPMLTKKTSVATPLQINVAPNHIIYLEAACLNFSFILEAFLNPQLGILLRGALLSCVLFYNFSWHQRAYEKSYLGWGLSLSTIALPTTYFLLFIFPETRPHLIHLIYILGFALTTLLVSVRVTLAHGNFSLEIERTSRHILILCFIVFSTAIVRVSIPILMPDKILFSFLLGSLTMIVAISYWLFFLAPKILKGSDDSPRC